MIGKIICSLLLLAGFVDFTRSSTIDEPVSQTFWELHDEALKACMFNSTRSFLEMSKASPRGCMAESECVCPMLCYFEKLGIVNDAGLNKIAVNWIRTFVDHVNANYEQIPKHPEWASIKSIEAMISLIPIFLDPLSSACSSKNETTIEDLNMKIRGSLEKAYEEQHPKHFIPSEEDSPILELILNATNTCSAKFNASSFAIGLDVVKYHPLPPKRSICYIHCMLSELDFVNEAGLNEPWAGVFADVSAKHNRFLATVNEGTILVHSKCATEFDELPDNYFDGAFQELEERHNENERHNML